MYRMPHAGNLGGERTDLRRTKVKVFICFRSWKWRKIIETETFESPKLKNEIEKFQTVSLATVQMIGLICFGWRCSRDLRFGCTRNIHNLLRSLLKKEWTWASSASSRTRSDGGLSATIRRCMLKQHTHTHTLCAAVSFVPIGGRSCGVCLQAAVCKKAFSVCIAHSMMKKLFVHSVCCTQISAYSNTKLSSKHAFQFSTGSSFR